MAETVDAVLARMDAQQTIEVAPDATPVDFLQKVYRSPAVPLHSRLKAAVECAQYVHPKLAVTAVFGSDDFATALEDAIERSGKVIEHREPNGAPRRG